MHELKIGKNDAGQRLDKFITKTLDIPASLLYKSIRLKKIKVNRKRAENNTVLCEGDTVQCFLSDEFFEKKVSESSLENITPSLDIIYEDENIMLLNKRPGVSVHEDENGSTNTLITHVQAHLFAKGEYDPKSEQSFAPALCNRIDRNTGGIVIAAKNAESLRILNQKLKDREMEKYYLCVIHGTLNKKSGLLTGWLIKDEKKNKVEVFSSEKRGAKEIKTKYSVLSEKDGLSLVEVELLTGRTHQIRAHFASIGHPLLGDGKYGTNALNKALGYKKQFLYSYRLRFTFISDAGCLEYLNGKSFEVPDVWFKREFIEGTLTK